MSLDFTGISARFKRAGAADPAPDGAPPQPSDPAPVEQAWLTAEAPNIAATPQTPTAESNTQTAAGPPPSAPPRRTSGRGPKRRRGRPGSPATRRQEPTAPPPALPRFLMPTGTSALYGRPLNWADDPYQANPRPRPLNREGPVNDDAVRRDSFSVWRGSPTEPPTTPTPSIGERLSRWYGDLFGGSDQEDR
jgi:hypothetical protein